MQAMQFLDEQRPHGVAHPGRWLLAAGLAGYLLGDQTRRGRRRADRYTGQPLPRCMSSSSVVIPIRNEAPNLEELHLELSRSARRLGPSLRDDRRRRWQHRRQLPDPGAAPGGRPAPARSSASAATSARRRRSRPASRTRAAGSSSRRTATCRTTRATSRRWSPRLESDDCDIVCGWRKDRKDAFLSRLLPSMLANRLISWATGVRLHDYGCSLKVFRAEVVKPLKLYGEMHRFIPAIASEQGVTIAEVVVNHRARRHGTSKYGISRTIRVILDLLTVKFLLSYSTRPLQIFGLIGIAMLTPAVIILAYLAFVKVVRRPGDRQSTAAAARHPADLHRRAAGDAGAAGGTAGAHLPRVAGQADLRHSRDPRGSGAARAGWRPAHHVT